MSFWVPDGIATAFKKECIRIGVNQTGAFAWALEQATKNLSKMSAFPWAGGGK